MKQQIVKWGTVACLLVPLGVHSTQTPSSLPARAIVQPNCNIVGSSVILSFGNYDPTATNITSNLDSITNFSIRCTKGTSAAISLNNGLNYGSGIRRLSNGLGDFLTYQLYSDSGRSTIWDTSNVMNYAASSAVPTTFTLYGRVPAGQTNVSVGNYTDAVTITVTF